MKKFLALLAALTLIFTTGCEEETKVLKKTVSISEEVDRLQGELAEEIVDSSGTIKRAPERYIPVSTTLHLNNEATILLDEHKDITDEGMEGRIVLATDAKEENGELMLEDTNYWCLAVLVDSDEDGTLDGAYNLHYGDTAGNWSVEVVEYKINGKNTPVIILTISTDESKEIREYIFSGNEFGEWIIEDDK